MKEGEESQRARRRHSTVSFKHLPSGVFGFGSVFGPPPLHQLLLLLRGGGGSCSI